MTLSCVWSTHYVRAMRQFSHEVINTPVILRDIRNDIPIASHTWRHSEKCSHTFTLRIFHQIDISSSLKIFLLYKRYFVILNINRVSFRRKFYARLIPLSGETNGTINAIPQLTLVKNCLRILYFINFFISLFFKISM